MIANCTTTAMGYCCRLYKSSQGRTDLIFNRKIKEKIMKNDAENQKKYPQNFFKRHSEHNPGNYITISTEIMKYRNSAGKPLPDEVIGYYFRLRTLQDGFYYNIKGISSITGKNKDTSAKRHNILEELGYIEKYNDIRDSKGRFCTPIYILNETTNRSLWKKDKFPLEIQQIIDNNPQSEKSGTESPRTEKSPLYKKEKKYKEKNNKRNIYTLKAKDICQDDDMELALDENGKPYNF